VNTALALRYTGDGIQSPDGYILVEETDVWTGNVNAVEDTQTLALAALQA
jgi:hypothetical protein